MFKRAVKNDKGAFVSRVQDKNAIKTAAQAKKEAMNKKKENK